MKQGQRLVNQEAWLSVQNANLARIWAQKVNVHHAQSAALRNVQTYTSSAVAKQIVPIIATTALLEINPKVRKREKNNNY